MRTEASRSAAIGGTHINYELTGPAVESDRPGPTLVLIHGFAASLRTWDRIVPALRQYHQVLTIDLKGFGLSGHPRDGRYAIDDNVAIVIELLAQLQLSRAVLIGHSYGGAVAGVVTATLRSRLGGAGPAAAGSRREMGPLDVEGLVLIDAASYRQRLPFFVGGLRNPILRWLSPFLGSARTRSRFVLRSLFVDRSLIDAEIVERYAFPMRIEGSDYGYAQTALQILPESFDAVTAMIRSIDVPTQIIWGDGDRAVPVAFAQQLHEDIRGSRIAVIPGVGHMPHEERPNEVLRLLAAFLTGLGV